MKALIICDGDPPPIDSLRKALVDSDLLIAADGGANMARHLKIVPDVIIGDLDSYHSKGDELCEVIHDPDQNTNDLEKALNYAISRSVNHVIVFGATGKRVDHTLKNLSVLLQFNCHFESIKFIDKFSSMYIIPSTFQTELPVGTSVSLFPLSGKVDNIRSEGLLYPLQNHTLENGVLDGTSNQTTKKKINIEFEKGDLLFLINHMETDR